MKIEFRIYPASQNPKVNLTSKYLPRIGDDVIYKGKCYQVQRSVHNLDDQTITVLLK